MQNNDILTYNHVPWLIRKYFALCSKKFEKPKTFPHNKTNEATKSNNCLKVTNSKRIKVTNSKRIKELIEKELIKVDLLHPD